MRRAYFYLLAICFFFTKCSRLFVVCSLFVYWCRSLVLAGNDHHRSVRIHTRVSIITVEMTEWMAGGYMNTIYSPSYVSYCGFICIPPSLSLSFYFSIKPFSQQGYPIQPAVTTTISSENSSSNLQIIKESTNTMTTPNKHSAFGLQPYLHWKKKEEIVKLMPIT